MGIRRFGLLFSFLYFVFLFFFACVCLIAHSTRRQAILLTVGRTNSMHFMIRPKCTAFRFPLDNQGTKHAPDRDIKWHFFFFFFFLFHRSGGIHQQERVAFDPIRPIYFTRVTSSHYQLMTWWQSHFHMPVSVFRLTLTLLWMYTEKNQNFRYVIFN